MSDTDTVEGTVAEVDEPQTPQDSPGAIEAASAPTMALEPAAAAAGGAMIRGEEPAEIIGKATQIANALKDLIDAQSMAVDVGGRKKHVEVSGWQACGTMLGALGGQPLHAETVWSRPARDPDTGELLKHDYRARSFHSKKQGGGVKWEGDVTGHDWEARVEIKTAAGVVVGAAEALCSRGEPSWAERPDPAVKSMAETRAESRAYRRAIGWIVSMAGYNPTPAEEMPGGNGGVQGDAPDLPPWAQPASDELQKVAKRAIKALAGGDNDVAGKLWRSVTEAPVNGDAEVKIGYMPRLIAQTIVRVASADARTRGETSAAEASPPAAEDASDQARGDASTDEPIDADVVAETDGETPPPGTVPADADDAADLCICEGGLAAAEKRPADQRSDECPIVNHGIPF